MGKKYKINFNECCTDAEFTKRLVYGEISAKAAKKIFEKKGEEPDNPKYVLGTLCFEFGKKKDKCTSITLAPTYYDKEDDTYWDEDTIDVYDIFYDRIDDALDHWKKGE